MPTVNTGGGRSGESRDRRDDRTPAETGAETSAQRSAPTHAEAAEKLRRETEASRGESE